MRRSITPGAVRHDVTVTGTGPAADVDWLYTGMAPMVRWDGESATTVVGTVAVADSPPVTLSSYAGTTPANLDYPDARRVGITADLLGTDLIYGMESGPASVPGAILNQFNTILRPNLGAASESGGLDWQAKAYVSGSASGGMTLGAGDMLGFFSRHVLRVDL
ncbi:hypothetical protein ACJ5NV_00670 [Loktanella agnita]|uniref:hypothetical protein n=1 Tax=Loktanella agnita TaxID=287097 RepID=UPI003987A50E